MLSPSPSASEQVEPDWEPIPAVHGSEASIEIQPVHGKAMLRRFVRLPETLHADDPHWVPPLLREEMRFLSQVNPYLRSNPTRFFLAWRGGEPVGRIAATVCNEHNSFHGERAGFFGYFDCDGKQETAAALVGAAMDFLRRRGMEVIRGPFNLTSNHTCGLLVDGFDAPPVVEMPYNPPHFGDLLEGEGFRKAKDLLAFWVDLREDSAAQQALAELAESAPPSFKAREMALKGGGFVRDLDYFYDLYHHAWRNNWGFVPLDREEYGFLLGRMKPILIAGLCQMVEVDGEPAGIFIGIPDVNQVLRGVAPTLPPRSPTTRSRTSPPAR